MLEMTAILYDGENRAEKELAHMRAERQDPWLSEVSVLEHDSEGRYSMKAKNPKVGDDKTGPGVAIGGLTGLFIGAIGGPFGLFLWSATGAMVGSAIGAASESAFKPTVDTLKARLAPGASMLILVGETETLDAFVAAADQPQARVMREPLSSAQAEELSKASAG